MLFAYKSKNSVFGYIYISIQYHIDDADIFTEWPFEFSVELIQMYYISNSIEKYTTTTAAAVRF